MHIECAHTESVCMQNMCAHGMLVYTYVWVLKKGEGAKYVCVVTWHSLTWYNTTFPQKKE